MEELLKNSYVSYTDTANSDETNTEKADNYKVDLLNNINNMAQSGMVINSEFKAKYDTIDKVNNAYGKQDTQNYVAEAKGVYYTFENKNLAFGFNKGDQIFEVRSFDKSLKELNLQDIISYFGEPQYEVITDCGTASNSRRCRDGSCILPDS